MERGWRRKRDGWRDNAVESVMSEMSNYFILSRPDVVFFWVSLLLLSVMMLLLLLLSVFGWLFLLFALLVARTGIVLLSFLHECSLSISIGD